MQRAKQRRSQTLTVNFNTNNFKHPTKPVSAFKVFAINKRKESFLSLEECKPLWKSLPKDQKTPCEAVSKTLNSQYNKVVLLSKQKVALEQKLKEVQEALDSAQTSYSTARDFYSTEARKYKSAFAFYIRETHKKYSGSSRKEKFNKIFGDWTQMTETQKAPYFKKAARRNLN